MTYALGSAMVAASVTSVEIGYPGGVPGWQVEPGLAGFTAALVAAAALRGFAGIGWVASIGLVWAFAHIRPVREAGAARSSRSMGTRPRLFEDV